jgi:putative membrane protein
MIKRLFYGVLFIAALVFGLTFAIKNSNWVEINYYFNLHWTGPLSILLVVVMGAGALFGFMGALKIAFQFKRRLSQSEKQVRKLEQEIANLRAIPIKDSI